MQTQTDVLLVAATKIESTALFEAFHRATGKGAKPCSIADRIYFELGELNGARVSLAQCPTMGAGSPGASLQSVDKGLDAIQPTAVIMVGIAFGISKKWQKMGDILVAENLRMRIPVEVGH